MAEGTPIRATCARENNHKHGIAISKQHMKWQKWHKQLTSKGPETITRDTTVDSQRLCRHLLEPRR